jgi:hypothetical protein
MFSKAARDARKARKKARRETEAMAMMAFARPGSAVWNAVAMTGYDPARAQREARKHFGI